jgi:acid phosphatase family membrane protein YuiD
VELFTKKDLPEVKLKELVGHTPLQVLAGVTIGLCNAALLHYFVF